ncbi:MAG: ATP-binding protein [Proteobacteria bacterium]|nr:ATP-binding protein [Pseudomonadota bacterium]
MKRTFYLVTIIFCLQLILAVNPARSVSIPVAQKGVLDVSRWDFKTAGPLSLDGQWEFYWNKLISPNDFASGQLLQRTGYIDAPGYWDGYKVDGEELTGLGYATFHLKVTNLPPNELVAFDLPLMHTAYKLWANGELVATNGVVGTSRATSQPQFLPKTPVLKQIATEIDLVLQISNFHHNNGGIWQTLKIGLEEDISSIDQMRTGIELFILGAILIMALYHFALFALRRKEPSPMFFGLFCLDVAFRMSIHGGTFFSVIFPNASWEILVKLDYFTLYFGLTFYCAFIQSLFPSEFKRIALNIIVIISIGFVLFTIVTPATTYTAYLVYYQAVMVLASLFTLIVLVLAVAQKRDGARVVLSGCALIIVSLVNDILYNHEVIHTAEIIGFGLFFMIFMQSYVLSAKFSKAFDMVEELSIGLDRMVKERTAAIKDLLDNTGQGFFSFARDHKVQQFTSKATYDFFGKAIEDENALELMFPDDYEDKEKLLNLVFEDAGNLTLVEGILPSEVTRDEHIYNVDYHWIEPRQNVDGRIMIVMTDITTQRKLEQQLKSDEEKNRMIVKIAVDRHGFIDFLNEVNMCLDKIKEILSGTASDMSVKELFRYFHTIKGGMSSYFFTDVANKAHDIENLLESLRTDSALPTEDLLKSVDKETDQLKEELKKTLNGLDQIIPKQLIEAGFQPYFRISESKITQLEAILKKDLNASPALTQAVKGLRRQPIRNIMKKFASDAEDLAVNLGKKVKITLEGEETEIVHNSFKPMLSSLIHIVRNCVDHGIEEPETRLAARKPEIGNLDIKVAADEKELKINIADDGAGIDAETIKSIALDKGLIGTTQVESMTESELVKLIFAPGFSTNEVVTDLSGRGVGMDAVAEEVAKLEGSIDVLSTPGVGTQFMITVPNA